MFGSCKIFSRNAIFGKGKYFQVFGCIMKIVVENIFMCLVLLWKCYFPTNFSHFLSYFLSIQTNFIIENFKIIAKSQSTEQITAKSQHHTPPKLQFNPRQQTSAIKSHNHQNTTTTPPQQQQKSKSHRNQNHIEREISGSKVRSRRGEIEWRRDRRRDRVARCCDRWEWCDLVRAIIGLELGVRRRRRRLVVASDGLSLSLSLSLFAHKRDLTLTLSLSLFSGKWDLKVK